MDAHSGQDRKAAGWMLVATGALSILLMSQHPSGSHEGVMTPLVHGGLQVVMIAQLAAMFVAVRGWGWTLLATSAVLFFAAGQMAGVGAATINGFIVPALGGYDPAELGSGIGPLAWEANQALARLGVIAVGIGFALISTRLWQDSQRALAIFGWLAGLVPALLLITGQIGMDLHGALFAYITQAAFIVAFGWTAARRF